MIPHLIPMRHDLCRPITWQVERTVVQKVSVLPSEVRQERAVITGQGSSCTVSTCDWATGWTIQEPLFSSPQRQEDFSFPEVQTGSGAHPSSYSVGTTSFLYGGKEGEEGNCPPTLFPRLRVSGSVPPLPHTP